jgi:hypothetical protein
MDMVIFNRESDRTISELTFRHGCGRGCDDRDFKLSRHVKDGFDDLLKEWAASPYNQTDVEDESDD